MSPLQGVFANKGHELNCTLCEDSSPSGTSRAQNEEVDFGEFNPIELQWIRRSDKSILGDRDSNPDPTVQSRVPYHWTISQFLLLNRRISSTPEPTDGSDIRTAAKPVNIGFVLRLSSQTFRRTRRN